MYATSPCVRLCAGAYSEEQCERTATENSVGVGQCLVLEERRRGEMTVLTFEHALVISPAWEVAPHDTVTMTEDNGNLLELHVRVSHGGDGIRKEGATLAENEENERTRIRSTMESNTNKGRAEWTITTKPRRAKSTLAVRGIIGAATIK